MSSQVIFIRGGITQQPVKRFKSRKKHEWEREVEGEREKELERHRRKSKTEIARKKER